MRFEAKGIAVENMSSYLDNDEIVPGLLNELKRNLQMQTPTTCIVTDIYIDGDAKYSIIQSSNVGWGDGTKAFPNANVGRLAICVPFISNLNNTELELIDEERQEVFRSLECFELFQHRYYKHRDSGQYQDEYILDFGSDAFGAASLLSKIIYALYDPEDVPSIAFDTDDWPQIQQHRKDRLGEPDTESSVSQWFSYVAAFVIIYFILNFVIGC